GAVRLLLGPQQVRQRQAEGADGAEAQEVAAGGAGEQDVEHGGVAPVRTPSPPTPLSHKGRGGVSRLAPPLPLWERGLGGEGVQPSRWRLCQTSNASSASSRPSGRWRTPSRAAASRNSCSSM